MSLFTNPEEHAANPPSTWKVERVGRRYALQTAGGITLQTYSRKQDAEAAMTSGPEVSLYDKEARWYAGEQVDNWRSYADCVGDQSRTHATATTPSS